jgi:YesN/AraC family two-component response regulator
LSKNLPIKEIAENVGVPDIHYFTKMFKRTYHLPPARYRKELRS